MGRGNLREVASFFLKLGLLAYGGAAGHVAMMRRELVDRRKWISEQDFLDLFGIMNLIPGPSSTETVIALGYWRAGWLALILAGVLFILPAMLMILALSWAYVRYGTLPAAQWILYGINPIVIAIIADALLSLGRTALKTMWLALMAVASLTLYFRGVSIVAIIVGTAVLAAIAGYSKTKGQQKALGIFPLAAGGTRITLTKVTLTTGSSLWKRLRPPGFSARGFCGASPLADGQTTAGCDRGGNGDARACFCFGDVRRLPDWRFAGRAARYAGNVLAVVCFHRDCVSAHPQVEEGARSASLSRRDQRGDGGIDGGGFLATRARDDSGRVHRGGSDRGFADLEAVSDQFGVADSGRIDSGIRVEIRDGRGVERDEDFAGWIMQVCEKPFRRGGENPTTRKASSWIPRPGASGAG
jgi:chromate transport protein ChrA